MQLYSSPFIIVCWIAASVSAGIGVNINIGKAKGNVGKAEGNVEKAEGNVGKAQGNIKEKVEHELPTGLVPAVFTPFNDDYTINYSVIPGYVEFLAKRNIKGILVAANLGEGTSLSVEERKKLTEAWVAAAKPYGTHVMVQVGGSSLPEVLEFTKHAQEAGADSVMTLPELFYKPSTVELLVKYVARVAAEAPKLPVLYYHYPAVTNVDVSMPAFVTAAAKNISNFRGLRLSSDDMKVAQAVLNNIPKGQKAYMGADPLLASAAIVGFDSIIGSTYNFIPELAADILEAVECGDVKKVRDLQRKLSQSFELLTVEGDQAQWIPGLKFAMELVSGIKVGPPRPPLQPATHERKLQIEAGLKELGIIGQ